MKRAPGFLAALERGADAAAVRELERAGVAALAKPARAIAEDATKKVGTAIAELAIRTFAGNAKRAGFDLKSMLAPKKKDRTDAQRKSPGQIGKALEKNYGISLNDPWVKAQMKAFAKENAERVSNLTKNQMRRMANATINAIEKGHTRAELGKKISEIAGVTQREGRRLASDQAYTLNAKLTRAVAIEVGQTKYVWQNVGDEKVRPLHVELNDKVFDLEDDPPDPDGHPGEPHGCRCGALIVFEE